MPASFEIICRVLHIAATCTSLGGLTYARFVLWPNLEFLPESDRQNFLDRMIRRYAYIKWMGVLVVAVTGIIQWLYIYPLVSAKGLYIGCFAIKMLGAVGLFLITFLLTLPTERLRGMQQNRAFWSGMNVLCGITILIGAALMRAVRNGSIAL